MNGFSKSRNAGWPFRMRWLRAMPPIVIPCRKCEIPFVHLCDHRLCCWEISSRSVAAHAQECRSMQHQLRPHRRYCLVQDASCSRQKQTVPFGHRIGHARVQCLTQAACLSSGASSRRSAGKDRRPQIAGIAWRGSSRLPDRRQYAARGASDSTGQQYKFATEKTQ